MKKYIISAMIAMASAFAASADSSYALMVNTVEGNTIEYDFEYLPIATFEGDEMIIHDDRGSGDVRYAMENVLNMTIKAPTTGVSEVEEPARVKVRTENGVMTVSGLEAGVKVSVFDASGKVVAAAVADVSGVVSIEIGRLGKGVYVTSIPKHSFKFIR